jgi:uncharacterized protein with NAD-binding domain and iron-sulfur cluster
MAASPAGINVAIVGGGIAGLTAALRLAQSGCKVTVYEKNSLVGGNLGGDRDPQGNYHDVYPHMFGEWYDNFWQLVGELGLSRERDFEQRPTFALLKAGEFPNLKLLTNNGSLASALVNMTSGIIPAADMFLAAYSVIDILSVTKQALPKLLPIKRRAERPPRLRSAAYALTNCAPSCAGLPMQRTWKRACCNSISSASAKKSLRPPTRRRHRRTLSNAVAGTRLSRECHRRY